MNYLIFGATNDLGIELIKEIQTNDNNSYIIISLSSQKSKLQIEPLLNKINIKHEFIVCDFNNLNYEIIDSLKHKKIDHIYYLSAFTDIEFGKVSNEYLHKSLNINSNSILKINNYLLEKIQNDTCSVNFISSIATSIPKKKNYIYASSKLMLENYFKSLMMYFNFKKPFFKIYRLGYLSNKNMKKKFLSTDCNKVAKFIYKCQNEKKSKLYYFPRFWRIIIYILLILPKTLINKMNP